MELDKKWDWEKRKLACKIRIETGNPGSDELSQQMCKLLDMDFASFQRNCLINREEALENLKRASVKDPAKEEKKSKDYGFDRPNSVQTAVDRIKTNLRLFSQSDAVRPATAVEDPRIKKKNAMPANRKNLYKTFIEVPRSPPRRALHDLRMDGLNLEIKSVSKPVEDKETILAIENDESDPFRNAISLDADKKRRIKRMARTSPEFPKIDSPQGLLKGEESKTLFKPYNGDIFGTETKNEEGMIYLSRMAPRKRRQRKLKEEIQDNATPMAEHKDLGRLDCTTEDKAIGAPSAKEIQAKIHCAMTLFNWTNYDANTERLLKEGAVQAILRLSKESDKTIRKYCAAAFRQMSTRPLLCKQMVALGAVSVITDLLNNAGKVRHTRIDCTVALVNLTRNVGTEGKLVEDGIVMALMALPNDTEEWDELCARGLFNLTCVDVSYPFMERVIKAFMQLASSSFSSVKYICGSALCNIADLKPMRMRMVEEGIIQVLGVLSRGADMKTRRLCAIIIHSLAAYRPVRAEMASRGAIQVIYSLSADNDMTTLYCTASAILRLSSEDTNSGRLISEGGISAISNVAIRCADVASTSQACAGTLHILSTRPDHRSVIVQEGCIPALITMLRTSTDHLTLHYSVLAVCNLLTVEDNQVHILQQGGVQTIVQLCRHEHQGIQKSCAFAIFTLSCVEAARKQAASFGAIPVIISLAKVPDEQMQMFCAATLCMMSTDVDNISPMVREGVIQTFISLLKSTNISTIRYSCAALRCLAYNNSSCMNVLEEGAVPHVVSGAIHGDVNTQQSCCAVISALSTHGEIRQQLCNMDVLPALVSLSALEDEMTRLRCAVAFANLSCETMAQGMMVQQGVVPILSELSNSYSEENQLYCAKALCNLACRHGSEEAIVQQGGMAALMMIGMVRTVKQETKQICAKAVLNLLNARTLSHMAAEGLVTACSSLCKMEDDATMKACAYIFCSMSLESFGRKSLIEKVAALHGLFRLMRSPDPTTKTITAKTVCNLLSFEDSRLITVGEGGVEVLREISTIGDHEAEKYCSEAFFRMSGAGECRSKLVETRTLPVIVLLARSPDNVTRRTSVNLLSILTWHLDTRAEFLKSNGVSALVAVLRDIEQEQTVEDRQALVEVIIRAFSYLSMDPENHEAVISNGIISAIIDVHNKGYINTTTYGFIALTLRHFSGASSCRAVIIAQGALNLLGHTVQSVPGEVELMMNSAVTLHNFAGERDLRKALTGPEGLKAIVALSTVEACKPVLSAILYTMSLESSNKVPMVSGGIPQILYKFLENPGEDEDMVTQNSCATVLMLSKSPDCRAQMQQASLVPILIKLSKSKSPKICDSASQALNCLSANSRDGIEEGTVAALIAIALDGNAASKTEIHAEDYLQVPNIATVDESLYAPPDRLTTLPPYVPLEALYMKMPAGPAGKGPKPPKPPSILDDKRAIGVPGGMGGAEEDNNLDSEDEPAGLDKIMMFAKMDLPIKFLEEAPAFEDEVAVEEEFKLTMEMEEAPLSEEAPKIQSKLNKPLSQGNRSPNRQKTAIATKIGNKRPNVPVPVTKASSKAIASTPGHERSIVVEKGKREVDNKKPTQQSSPGSHKVKTSNFFESHNFVDDIRSPQNWDDLDNHPPKTQPKNLGEKAAQLGLWNNM